MRRHHRGLTKKPIDDSIIIVLDAIGLYLLIVVVTRMPLLQFPCLIVQLFLLVHLHQFQEDAMILPIHTIHFPIFLSQPTLFNLLEILPSLRFLATGHPNRRIRTLYFLHLLQMQLKCSLFHVNFSHLDLALRVEHATI